MKRIFLSICVCSMLLFCLTGCGKQEEKSIEDKLNSELEYVEDLIFKIVNKYAKQEYMEEDEIKWEDIKEDVQKINSAWSSQILDLTDVNVANQDILDYSTQLNNLLISVHNEDEQVMINQLNELYKKVIIFREAYFKNRNKIQKNKVRSGVLSAFNQVNQDQWDKAKSEINKTIEDYKNLMNDIGYAEENKYNLNKIYVLLEEYKNAIGGLNYDLVRMKYIVTVENL